MPSLRRIRRSLTGADRVGAAPGRLVGRRIEPNRQLRGHAFLPAAQELARIPSIAAARRLRPAQRILWLHYFTGYCDWYVCGLDNHTGEAYGYVVEPAADISQWSYCDLHTMCLLIFPADLLLIVRRDLRWQPSPAARIIDPVRAHPHSRSSSA